MDKTYYYWQESRLLVIVVSILLHLLLLIIIFMVQTMGPLSDAEKSFLQPNLQDITTILSQSPVQAANVIFQDLPTPADYDYDEKAVQSATTTTVAPARPDGNIDPATTTFEEPSEQESNQHQETGHDDEAAHPATSIDYEVGVETTVKEPYERYSHDSLATPSPTQYVIHEKSQQRPRKKTRPKNKNPYARPVSREAAAALGRITTGFMQSMQQEQGGVPKVQQDLSALKQHMFNTKVWSILRQTINAQQELIHLPHNLTTEATITITIGKKGNFIDLQLLHENKTSELAAIERVLRKAACSAGLYLPIPSHLNTDTLTLRFRLNIQGERGVHTYHLSYQ